MFILKCIRLLGSIAAGSIFGVAICIIVNALLDSFVVGSVFGVASYIIAYKFTKDIITEKIRKKCEKAFKANIKKRKRKAVYVGIFEKRIQSKGKMLNTIISIGKKAIEAAAILAVEVVGFTIYAASIAIGGIVYAITIAYKITKETIVEKVNEIIAQKARKELNKAIKAKILEAKKNTVHVGIWDKDENPIGEMTIKSEQGVDASIKQGDVILI